MRVQELIEKRAKVWETAKNFVVLLHFSLSSVTIVNGIDADEVLPK